METFRYFVVLAGMRTGSNFLEASLNKFADISCLGELFNPVFVGHPNKSAAFDIDLAARERDPLALITRMVEQTDGLPGFRLFHDHDARIITHVLNDPSCAKILLTRRFTDSYVSLKIAEETGQWRLSDASKRKTAVVRFDPDEFEEQRAARLTFSQLVKTSLQHAGQTAFDLTYDDLNDVAILNGLGRFLGSDDQIQSPAKSLKRQNPSHLREKVSNYAEMTTYLSETGHFEPCSLDLEEPRRGPGVKRFVIAQTAPLLFIPIPGAPDGPIREWLAALDGVAPADLPTGLSQKALRQWRKANPGHRSFTVLRHPLARAHSAFCDLAYGDGGGLSGKVQRVLRDRYDISISAEAQTLVDHKAAFIGFLKFLKMNLAAQTSLGIDPSWATQFSILQAASKVVLPDLIIREADLTGQLKDLARQVGFDEKTLPAKDDSLPFNLTDIYDRQLEKRSFDAYRKDYIQFGFGDWR